MLSYLYLTVNIVGDKISVTTWKLMKFRSFWTPDRKRMTELQNVFCGQTEKHFQGASVLCNIEDAE